MTEPAEVVQKIALSVLDKFSKSEAVGSLTEVTPVLSAFVDIWREVKSPAFLATLRKDPDVASLASKQWLEAEAELVKKLSQNVEALNGTIAALKIELQREQARLQVERETARGEQLKLRAELEGKVAALVVEKDALLLEREGLRAEVTSVTDRIGALIAEDEARLRERTQEVDRLGTENAALKREKAENKAEKAILELGRLIFKPDFFARYVQEGTIHAHVKDVVQRRQKFWLDENGIARRREELERGLTEEQRGFVEADRIQLRDKRYPKFVNRRDLVRRLRPANAATVAGLLTYRRKWDRKLAGQKVRQDIVDKLSGGMPAWKGNANINDLSALSKASRVDRGTLRKYHNLGIVDLSWCADITNDRPERHGTREGRTAGENSLAGSGRLRRPAKAAKHRQTPK